MQAFPSTIRSRIYVFSPLVKKFVMRIIISHHTFVQSANPTVSGILDSQKIPDSSKSLKNLLQLKWNERSFKLIDLLSDIPCLRSFAKLLVSSFETYSKSLPRISAFTFLSKPYIFCISLWCILYSAFTFL